MWALLHIGLRIRMDVTAQGYWDLTKPARHPTLAYLAAGSSRPNRALTFAVNDQFVHSQRV
jgi:hypothetical protein